MTISSQTRTAGPFTGTGLVSAFPFTFKVFQTVDLLVVRAAPDGTQSDLVLSSDYTVTLNVDQNAAPGGTVTLLAPLASGYQLTVTSNMTVTQGASLTNGGGFYPKVIEDALDRLTILMQEQGFIGSAKTLRVPEIGGVPALPKASSRALKLLGFDAAGNPLIVAPNSQDASALALRLNSTAAGDGAALVAFNASASHPAGSLAAKNQQFVSITDAPFLAVSGSDATAAINAASAYCNSREIPGDAGGPSGGVCLMIPAGTFPISADVTLPRNVICYGQITGAYNLKWTQVKRGSITGLRATNLLVDGLWFSSMQDCYINNLTIKGGGVGYGTFWNRFENIEAAVTIDLSNWSVNQNQFSGRGGFITVGTTGTLLDGHVNNVDMWDFTGGQCYNTSTIQQDSVLMNTYYEAGADIAGPYHVIGGQGDAGGPPAVNRNNHILALSNVIERNHSDFLAAGANNLVLGGEWEYLNSSGYPAGFTFLGVTPTVYGDSTEPFGMGYKVGATFTTGFSGLRIVLPICRSGSFSLVLAYQSPNNFASVEIARSGGTTSYGGESVRNIDPTNSWKLLRLSGYASTTGPTTISFYALTAGGSVGFNFGGCFATQEKAALMPTPDRVRRQQGTATQGYVSAPPTVDTTITFPRAFSAAPTVNISLVNAGGSFANHTKSYIQSVSASNFVVRTHYATDWQGGISWTAVGPD